MIGDIRLVKNGIAVSNSFGDDSTNSLPLFGSAILQLDQSDKVCSTVKSWDTLILGQNQSV